VKGASGRDLLLLDFVSLVEFVVGPRRGRLRIEVACGGVGVWGRPRSSANPGLGDATPLALGGLPDRLPEAGPRSNHET